jgi:hypothetical protein
MDKCPFYPCSFSTWNGSLVSIADRPATSCLRNNKLQATDFAYDTTLSVALLSSVFCTFLVEAGDGKGRLCYCFDGYDGQQLVVITSYY